MARVERPAAGDAAWAMDEWPAPTTGACHSADGVGNTTCARPADRRGRRHLAPLHGATTKDGAAGGPDAAAAGSDPAKRANAAEFARVRSPEPVDGHGHAQRDNERHADGRRIGQIGRHVPGAGGVRPPAGAYAATAPVRRQGGSDAPPAAGRRGGMGGAARARHRCLVETAIPARAARHKAPGHCARNHKALLGATRRSHARRRATRPTAERRVHQRERRNREYSAAQGHMRRP